ncbi:MAG TPA: hypothetical protein VJ112_01400 [Rhabdochlamydiaceae bacterium]|nr:hypothetical protein [Rhabdochlamydiaceae bacterium]
MPKHINNGDCLKCDEIFARYPGFHFGLRSWFEEIQTKDPSAHVSCAGRGRIEQEEYFKKKTSRAHWKESAHNYNAALDVFRLTQQGASYDRSWFKDTVGIAVEIHNSFVPDFHLEWYGAPEAKFKELPHVQIYQWRNYVRLGLLHLVEKEI